MIVNIRGQPQGLQSSLTPSVHCLISDPISWNTEEQQKKMSYNCGLHLSPALPCLPLAKWHKENQNTAISKHQMLNPKSTACRIRSSRCKIIKRQSTSKNQYKRNRNNNSSAHLFNSEPSKFLTVFILFRGYSESTGRHSVDESIHHTHINKTPLSLLWWFER